MDQEPSAPHPQPQIPFSPAYLLAVALAAAFNSLIFGYLATRQSHGLENWMSALYLLCLFFGVLFAAGCNLTAVGVAQRLRRKGVTDRILLLLLIDIGGLTLLALALPFALSAFFE